MTLTTEKYTEGLCGDGAAILCDGVPMSVSEILAALNAAYREAQPVGKAEITKIAAELARGDYLSKLWTEAEKSRHVDTLRLQNLLDELHDVMKVKAIAITQLLTAPPAPAYPERLPCPVHLLPGLKFGKGVPTRSMLDALVRRAEYEAELDAMTPEQKAENYARLDKLKELIPQPAMPGIITASMAAEKAFQLGAVLNGDEAEQFAEGWNACRAAMLAQPVSLRYTLPPHVYRELVNCLRDTAVKYQGTQQLREQLSRTLTENGLSAATLEGSSD